MTRLSSLSLRKHSVSMNFKAIPKRLSGDFRARVFVSFYLSMVIISGLFNFVFYQWQKSSFEQEIIGDGKLLARVLADNVVLGVFSGSGEQIAPAMEAVLEQESVLSVAVFDKQGNLLHEVHRKRLSRGKNTALGQAATQVVHLPSEEYQEQKRRFLFWHPVRISSYVSEEAMYFADSPAVETEVIGYAQVALSKERLQEGFREILSKTIAIALLFLFVGFLVTYVVVQGVTRPLNRLIEQVEPHKVEGEKPKDQLSMLSGTFSDLLDRLGTAFETINNLKNNLEVKVEERTHALAEANAKLSRRQDYLEETNRKLGETMRELRETQAQMIQSEKMVALGQLVAGVAHEINNTTNFITGALPPLGRVLADLKELLAKYKSLDEKGTKKELVKQLHEVEDFKEEIQFDKILWNLDLLLANIQEGAQRTSQIVRDLKNFARPGTGNRKAVDIHQNLDSTLSLLYSDYKHAIEVKKEYEENLPPIVGSPSQLNQVFMNLLLNAVQAIDGPGEIRIRTRSEADKVHVSIKDSGGGIPEEIIGHIFDPFFTTKPVGKGTGLGLSISYGIIKNHGGEIRVESEIGKGTEFELILPIGEKG